jgi:transketolase N-terminal domain/subunit
MVNDVSFATEAPPRLDERSIYLRRLVVRTLDGGARGHIGSSLSLIEIMRVLYDDILRVRAAEPLWPQRDRCILSKGHGGTGLAFAENDANWHHKSSIKKDLVEQMYGALEQL